MSCGIKLIAGSAFIFVGSGPVIAAPLWSGLTSGMTADQTANQALKISGIRDAKAKTNDNGPSKVNLSYDKAGITLLGMRLEMRPLFQGNSLAGVLLNSSSICVSQMTPRAAAVALGLNQKYSRDLGLGIVTLPGTKGAPQRGADAHRYTDGITRASFYLVKNLIRPPEPMSAWQRTNAMARMDFDVKSIVYRQAISSCPEGEQQSIHILYEDLREASFRDQQFEIENTQLRNEKIETVKKELEKL